MNEQTTKKVKVIGTEEYINKNTGELQEMQVVSVEDRDFNFHKLWLSHIINSLDLIGNQKTKLAFWIIDHLNRDNQLTMTYRQISKKSGISYQTIARTMQVLIDSNFMVKINTGCYQVNPDVIFKGTRTGRLNVLYQYRATKAEIEQERESNEQERKTGTDI